jgi:hypothetical protein
VIASTHFRFDTRRLLSACTTVLAVAFACAGLVRPAFADIGVTGTSTPTTYTRGRINSYLLDLSLISDAFSGADALTFSLPARVTLSAVRKRNTFSFCSDVYPLVNGMGTSDGGWYQLGYPVLDGCGSLAGSPAPGEEQIVIVDIDIPTDYTGDLPLVVDVLGDGNGGPPNEASLTLTITDDGAPIAWHFDDATAPALPGGWTTTTAGDGVAWTTESAIADSTPNAVYAPTPATSGEAVLTSASVTVPAGGGELHFRQRYATEAAHDGGVLELAIDGGGFTDLLAAGGQFTAGGYTGSLASGCTGDENPLAGRDAWNGTQDAFAPVVAELPASAAGHDVQFRWRLGTDCAGAPDAPNGWWIDDVRLVSTEPVAALPAKLAVTLGVGAQRIEMLAVGNDGGGALSYASTTAAAGDGNTPPDCSMPVTLPWLSIAPTSGSVLGDTHDDVALTFDAGVVAAGEYAGTLCVATNDATEPLHAIPLSFSVSATPCVAADRIFANGFDDGTDGACGRALRTFDDRDAFLAAVAPGYEENAFTALRTGYVHGPLPFGSAYTYAVTAAPQNDIGDFYLFDGAGELSTISASDASSLTITFTGAPVTALGGNVWGQLFDSFTSVERNLQPPTTIRIELDDGTVETFTATSQRDFRGFIATQPIHSFTLSAPEADADGDFVWGVFDNLVVGTAR